MIHFKICLRLYYRVEKGYDVSQTTQVLLADIDQTVRSQCKIFGIQDIRKEDSSIYSDDPAEWEHPLMRLDYTIEKDCKRAQSHAAFYTIFQGLCTLLAPDLECCYVIVPDIPDNT